MISNTTNSQNTRKVRQGNQVKRVGYRVLDQNPSSGTSSGTANRNISSSKGRDLSNMIQQQYDAAKKAALMENAYGVAQGVSELQRSYEDALPSYQTSRDQAAIKTQNGLDNSALRSALLGDRGGIGQREYDVTRNAGENQQLQINLAQQKQKTDTDRQIADLKAKGQLQAAQIEANNAIEALKALQQEKQRLQEMAQEDYQFNKNYAQQQYQFDKNYAQNQYQFDKNYDQSQYQFDKNYALKEADLTGNYQGGRTLSGQQADRQAAAQQWEKQLQEAELTGMYQGNPTLDAQKTNDSQTSDVIRLLIQIANATEDSSILNDLKNQLLNMIKK